MASWAGAAEPAPKETALAWTLKELGAFQPIELHGLDQSIELPIPIRQDDLVTHARLLLDYRMSPALIAQLSHIKVLLNDEVVDVISANRASGLHEIELDPHLMTEFAKLRLQFIGHYTRDCEFPWHTSLWAAVSRESRLEIRVRRVALRNDLALLPLPFVDERDNRSLTLPFVLASRPTIAATQAAAVAASWLGTLAAYRELRTPVLQGRLPDGHAVVLLTNADHLAELPLPAVGMPTLSIVSHPRDPAWKLLVLQGLNEQQLLTAARALALAPRLLTGARATVSRLDLPPPREHDDAPNFVPLGRKVPWAELVRDRSALRVRGATLPPLRTTLRLPGDAFAWDDTATPLHLRLRYSLPREGERNAVEIRWNGELLDAIALPAAAQGAPRLRLPFVEEDDAGFTRDVAIAPRLQAGDNQLELGLVLPPGNPDRCRAVPPEISEAALSPDSSIDLSRVEHYAAMPDLSRFARAGFPFSSHADLAQSVIVLPDMPNAEEAGAALALAARIGAITGAAAWRLGMAGLSELPAAAIEKDVLLVSSRPLPRRLAAWVDAMPSAIDADSRSAGAPRLPLAIAIDAAGGPASPQALGHAEVQSAGPYAVLQSFESPVTAGRTVVALLASDAARLAELAAAVADPAAAHRIAGDLVLQGPSGLEASHASTTYYVGRIAWWRWGWNWVRRHGLGIVLLGFVVGAAAPLMARSALRRLAASRVRPTA
jgi:hypothetical protein